MTSIDSQVSSDLCIHAHGACTCQASRRKHILISAFLTVPYIVGCIVFAIYAIVCIFTHTSATQMRSSGVIAHLVPCLVTFAAIFAYFRRRNSPSLPEFINKHVDIAFAIMFYWAMLGLLSWIEYPSPHAHGQIAGGATGCTLGFQEKTAAPGLWSRASTAPNS
ncbi:hypothetical protein HGRIS_011693 [Hohenbuehelia grisea]|uniref:Uncharacterized protein n=1 Tax=Hohenbuehelia grisea TaxID=104357 RepID=A0ABR3JX98_9AGAR